MYKNQNVFANENLGSLQSFLFSTADEDQMSSEINMLELKASRFNWIELSSVFPMYKCHGEIY